MFRRGGSRIALMGNRARWRALIEAPLQSLPQIVRRLAGRASRKETVAPTLRRHGAGADFRFVKSAIPKGLEF